MDTESKSERCDVDGVVITDDLARRPSRAPDHAAESRALAALVAEMSTRPDTVLQRLVETAMELTHADSAGISLLEPGGENGIFRWVATAGAWAPYRGGTMPREASPCGEVIARGTTLLLNTPQRAFPALMQADPGIREGLLSPFLIDGVPAGTVWVIKYAPDGGFEAEDARLLESLTGVASAAHQMVLALRSAGTALSESETRLALAIDVGGIGHWELDLASGGLTTSAHCRRNFGRPEDIDFSYDELVASIHPDDREQQQSAIAAAVEAQSGFEIEYRIITPQDETRWVHIRGRYENGGGPRLVGVSLDATERKRVDIALHESEERQAFLLKLSDALQPLNDVAAIADTACRLAVEELGASRAQFTDVEGAPGKEIGEVRGEYVRVGVPMARRFAMAAYGEQLVSSLRDGKTLILTDADTDPRLTDDLRQAFRAVDSPAAIAVPLVKGGLLITTLAVHDSVKRAWTSCEVAIVQEIAERTWAAVEHAGVEAALRESEARLAAAFEGVPVGAAVIDLSGKAVICNAEYRRFLPTKIIPSRDPARVARWRAWDAEGRPLDPQQFPGARAIRGERVVPGQEMLYTDDDGREIWTRVATVPTRDGHGQVTGAVTTISNIDAAKRAAETLRESEKRLQQFGEASQDVLWTRDAATFQWEYLTPAFETIYGLDREAALRGDNFAGWLDLILPEDREHAAKSLERVRDGEWVTFEYRVRRPVDGRIRWLRNTDFPIQDQAGRVVRIGGIGHDITALKKTERALAQSDARQRALIDGIPQLVWRAYDGGRWTWASPQWTEFTGQAEGDSHGFGWLDAVHPDDRQAVCDIWAGAIGRGEFHADYRLCDAKEKRYRWFQTSATPVRDAAGEIVEWLGTSTDVDDLRNLQHWQEVLVAELQHRVRNILTIVRSVFSRTVETGDDVEEIANHFKGRLDALARTQVIVTRSAQRTVDLEDLIREELLSVAVSDGPGLTIDGPEVKLTAKVAETLGLALHELTTNALKYGALKVPNGRLAISWLVNPGYHEDRMLDLTWAEQGVPAVSVRPTREGFGRELIEEALPYRLGAETKLEFGGGGIRCSISIPLPPEHEDSPVDTEADL